MPKRSARLSLADQSAAPGGAAAVDRALTLLKLFGTSRCALQLSELAERAQLYKSTTLRLLASLEHAQLVQRQPDGRYALGPAIPWLRLLFGLVLARVRGHAGPAPAGGRQ